MTYASFYIGNGQADATSVIGSGERRQRDGRAAHTVEDSNIDSCPMDKGCKAMGESMMGGYTIMGCDGFRIGCGRLGHGLK